MQTTIKQTLFALFAASLFFSDLALAKDPEGFKFSQIKKDGLYDKLGLKNGDILLSVDGKSLKNISELRDIFEGLQKNGGGMKLEVFRNGKTEVFKYDFKK